MYTTLIDSSTLADNLDQPNWVIIDCRFDLSNPDVGEQWYEEAHIPGAVYAHLDRDLSGPPVTDKGRHPLPTPEKMRDVFGRFGITPQTQVVAYDQVGGVYASRLWWMLRYMGHEAVAVLNGGWQVWEASEKGNGRQEVGESGKQSNQIVEFVGEPRREMLVLMNEVPAQPLLIDSRAANRYAGEVEPIDPVAGHIPGAVNHFYQLNWDEAKQFLPTDQLKSQFVALLDDVTPTEATFYCGSGVSACVNLLAMTHAGLPTAKLYVGSWSEWSRENPT